MRQAHVRHYDGLIFVCLSDSPPPFPAPPRDWIAPYGLGEAKVAHVTSYDVRANWKIVVENFLECYHCGTVHPEYTRVMAGAASSFLSRDEMASESGLSDNGTAPPRGHPRRGKQTDRRFNHGDTQTRRAGSLAEEEQPQCDRASSSGGGFAMGSSPNEESSASRHLEGNRLRGENSSELRSSASPGGSNPPAPKLPFRRGACTQTLDGGPVAPLMGTHREYDGAMLGLWIGWTLEMEANPDHVAAFRFTPREVERTAVEVHWLVRGDAVEGVDYDRQRLIEFWKITGEQDWRICEVVQTGVRSRHYEPGPLSQGERFAAAFLREYLEKLADGG
jgi:phenylpropionate dioxygenase-like ring-hydroxylating dioxygenase large terminal subunit